MKAFFERYSYSSVTMLVDQLAISLFGFSLATVSKAAESDTLLLVTGIASAVFYLAILYGTAWKAGSGDKVAIEYDKIPWKPFTGLKMSLLANTPNLILAILITIGQLAGNADLEGVPRAISMLIQGMYQGILVSVPIGNETAANVCWSFFVILLPAFVISTVGYIAGAKDFHLTSMGIPELPASDRPTRKELRERKRADKVDRNRK